MNENIPKATYIFLDEGGNFDFSLEGSKYFTLTSVQEHRPFTIDTLITDLRFDLIETGLDIECFHASEDRQAVRDKVFAIIQKYLGSIIVDSLIVEKRKTRPSLREDSAFYPRMLGYLLKFIIDKLDIKTVTELIVITDKIPVSKKRHIIEKVIKKKLKFMLPEDISYRLMHHESKSSVGLQVADYINWAIFRAWEREDDRSLSLIRSAIRSHPIFCCNTSI